MNSNRVPGKKPPIVFISDFGPGHYAGQLKGAAASVAPDAALIDLSHEITPQNVIEGAVVLADSVEAFPKGSIFVCVVDPGVGSDRRAIALQSNGWFFVGPDNGLMSLVPAGSDFQAVLLDKPEYFRSCVSSSFHGRDIFSPVAGHLWNGIPINDLGTQMKTDIVRVAVPAPAVSGKMIEGCSLFFDGFGNIITNINSEIIGEASWAVEIKRKRIGKISRTYSDAQPGRLCAIIGSSGRLEIAIRNGSASEKLHLASPKNIRIRLVKK